MSGHAAGWLAIAGLALGTYFLRAGFLLAAAYVVRLPARIREALALLPAATLAALVAPALLRPAGELSLVSAELGAAVVAALVAGWLRRPLPALALGLLVFWLVST